MCVGFVCNVDIPLRWGVGVCVSCTSVEEWVCACMCRVRKCGSGYVYLCRVRKCGGVGVCTCVVYVSAGESGCVRPYVVT